MIFEKAWPQTFVQSSELSRENIIRADKHVFEIKFCWQPTFPALVAAAEKQKGLKIKCFIS